MTLLLSAFWPGMAVAAALGLLVGGLAGWPARPAIPLSLCALALALAAAAFAGLAPGSLGLWLEGAALVLPAYLVGCAAGSTLRRVTAGHRGRSGGV